MLLDVSAVGFRCDPILFAYDWKTTALYALGIGARREELAYLYEGHGPRVYPTFAVGPVTPAVYTCLRRVGGDISAIVHAGQSLKLYGPIPPQGTLSTTAVVRGLYDMKRMTLVIVDTETRTEAGDLLFETSWSILSRAGGCAGPRPPKVEEVDVPKGHPADFRLELPTRPEQALLYRLSGDENPLHADPDFAARAGFSAGPILHGLCTYGFVGRAVVLGACAGDETRLARLDGQFRRPVWPGDTLVVEGTFVPDAPHRVALSVHVKERPDAVMTNTWAELRPSLTSASTSASC